ncbi:MAG: hypothetical protein QM783_12725 [Phycisphaerales bacterium]
MRLDPREYVYIESDGSARELHEKERLYLGTEFHPADGDRPYIKHTYEQRDTRGDLSGFMERELLPPGTAVAAAPAASPMKWLPPGQ